MGADPYAEFSPAPTAAASAADPYAEFSPADSSSSSTVPGDDGSLSFAAGRVAGLAARAGLVGAAGAVGSVASMTAQNLKDAFTSDYVSRQQQQQQAAANPQPAQPAQPYTPELSDFVHPDKWQPAAQYFADKAGLPKPETPTERVISSAAQAVPTGAAMGGVPGAVWSAVGGGASQATAEAGGGPVAQTLAGLAAGSVPAVGAGAAGLIRTATRGAGADAAAVTAGRIANAAENSVPLTAGQATGSRFLQSAERTSGNLWGGGPIAATAENQTAAIGNRVSGIVDNLNPGGAALTPTVAGTAINTGVSAAKQSMRQAETAAYNNVDALVPADHPVDVSGTLDKLDTLATPTPGAAATTGALVSPKIAQLRDNLASDTAANGGTLPYNAARQVRTQLGNSIDWGFAPADPVTNGALKQVHAALGDDLNAATTAISPEAAQATQAASALYAANSAKRDLLNSIVDKAGGPEAVYQAATNGTKQGATKINGVMSVLDPQNADVVRATVLSKLGQAVPSAADSTGSFNASTFLTKWNQLAPEAKDALFNGASAPAGLRKSLDSLTQTTSTLRDAGHTLENPSGTGSSMGHTFTAWGLMKTLATGVVGLGEAHSLGLSHTLMTAGGVVGAAGVNRALASALVNPKTAAWLARTTKMPVSALPNAVNQLQQYGKRNNDQDAVDLAHAIPARIHELAFHQRTVSAIGAHMASRQEIK